MLDRLNAITRRYEDLGQELMQVGADYQRAAEINKERVELEPLVLKSREYGQALKGLEEARAILASESDADAELRSLAEADVAALIAQNRDPGEGDQGAAGARRPPRRKERDRRDTCGHRR